MGGLDRWPGCTPEPQNPGSISRDKKTPGSFLSVPTARHERSTRAAPVTDYTYVERIDLALLSSTQDTSISVKVCTVVLQFYSIFFNFNSLHEHAYARERLV